MLKAGVNSKVVSDRLGHSTVSFTLDNYAHALPDMQRDGAEALARMIR
jgi:integrase